MTGELRESLLSAADDDDFLKLNNFCFEIDNEQILWIFNLSLWLQMDSNNNDR